MADFDYVSGNPDNLTGGGAANMADIQGPFVDLKEWLNTDLQPRVAVAVPTFVTTLPVSATDGQEIYFLADDTNGVVWHLRYRAASASAYKWEYVGGPPLLNEVVTAGNETTTSTAYAALTTPGPTVTVPLAGDYDVDIACLTANSIAGNASAMSYDIGATAAVDADAASLYVGTANNDIVRATRTRRKTLAAGAALTAKYKSVSAGTAYFWGTSGAPGAGRLMVARPVRVG